MIYVIKFETLCQLVFLGIFVFLFLIVFFSVQYKKMSKRLVKKCPHCGEKISRGMILGECNNCGWKGLLKELDAKKGKS